jgi:ankyrin repeat protein
MNVQYEIPMKDGSTALHIAASNGFTEIASLLIDNYCDVNALNKVS